VATDIREPGSITTTTRLEEQPPTVTRPLDRERALVSLSARTWEEFMEPVTETRDHRKALWRWLVYILVPLALGLLVLLAGAYIRDIPVTDLLRDPTATLDGPWYTGIVSTTGVALWASTAAICLLTMAAKPGGEARSLLLAGAVISLILGADDAYLIHETVKNAIGIPSPVTIAAYGVVAILLIRPAWRYLMARPDVSVFFAALALFALSVILDGAGELDLPTPPLSAVIEDMAKFLGIATWLTFFAWFCRDLVRPSEPAL
jgi:hypothetical protein